LLLLLAHISILLLHVFVHLLLHLLYKGRFSRFYEHTYLIVRLLIPSRFALSRRSGRLLLCSSLRLSLLSSWLLNGGVSGGGLLSGRSFDRLLLVFGWLVGHLRFAF
jgi:hypothetical protein